MKKTLIIILLTLLLCGVAFPAYAAEQPIQFTDIDPDSEIYTLVDAGIIEGFGDATFRPESPLTRAQAAKIINLIFGYSEQTLPADEYEVGFADVSPEDWFSTHAMVAQRAGYIKGYTDGTFREANLITRQEVCIIMVRLLELKSSELVDYLQLTEQITDPISDWAKDDVALFLSLGFIEPDSEGLFYATEPITRYDFCMLMLNFYDADIDEGGDTSGTPGSLDPKDPDNPDEDDAVASIRNVYAVLDVLTLGKDHPAASQQIIDKISATFKAVLEDAEGGTEITPEYIKSAYASEINSVRTLWSALTSMQRAQLRGELLGILQLSDINTLEAYFLN